MVEGFARRAGGAPISEPEADVDAEPDSEAGSDAEAEAGSDAEAGRLAAIGPACGALRGRRG